MKALELLATIPMLLAPEVECLAKNIYFEARDQTIAGQVAIAHVTKNRVESRKFKNSYCDVIYAKNQFSWTHDGKSDRPRNDVAYIQSIEIAYSVITGTLANDPTNGATHYHANYVKPCWTADYRYIKTIGSHLFYQRDKGNTCWKIAKGIV